MEVSDGRLTIRISQPLPVRWLNISLTTHRLADDPLQARATIGSLPLSPWLTRQTLALGLRVKGSDFNQLVQAVESAEITDNRLHARIRMPEGQAFLQQLSSAQIAIDPAQVRKIYCALTSEQLQSPDDLLATQLKRAVSGSGASAEQHGAALVALGMLVIDPRIGELANVQLSTVKVCRIAPIQATLAGRQDLAKHWTMSAVLLVTTNDDLAEATGVWKELSDTGTEKSRKQMRNTTGFSFVDIAADRSGLLVAKGLLDPERLSRTREQVMMVTDEQLLPTRAATLHEGLNDAQFQQLYGNAQDPRYLAKLGLIDRLLAAHWK
ncbi:MAG: hypothetical protein H6918_05140 [Sphingomonadaceae bacterium]|nr:hypothetical protein [Sphingomonadaceae bacterium]